MPPARFAVLASLLALAVLAPTPGRAETPANGTVLESVPYALAPWDSLTRGDRYLQRADYDAARVDRGLSLRHVTYASDGLHVKAIVAEARPRPAKPAPVIVFCRGGYTVGDDGWQYVAFFHHLVRAGFVVVAPMLRGSDGAEGHDEMGGADLDDLVNAVALARTVANGDTGHLYLCGESRGGAMTYLLLRRGFPARAAATWGAFSDLDTLMDSNPEVYSKVAPVVWPDFATRHAAISEERSAVRWAADLKTPLLLLHGGGDSGAPPSHSVRLAERLEAADREYRLVLFGGQGHTLKGVTKERDAAVADWFRSHDRH